MAMIYQNLLILVLFLGICKPIPTPTHLNHAPLPALTIHHSSSPSLLPWGARCVLDHSCCQLVTPPLALIIHDSSPTCLPFHQVPGDHLPPLPSLSMGCQVTPPLPSLPFHGVPGDTTPPSLSMGCQVTDTTSPLPPFPWGARWHHPSPPFLSMGCQVTIHHPSPSLPPFPGGARFMLGHSCRQLVTRPLSNFCFGAKLALLSVLLSSCLCEDLMPVVIFKFFGFIFSCALQILLSTVWVLPNFLKHFLWQVVQCIEETLDAIDCYLMMPLWNWAIPQMVLKYCNLWLVQLPEKDYEGIQLFFNILGHRKANKLIPIFCCW